MTTPDETARDRPTLRDAIPPRRAAVSDARAPIPVRLTLRWSDGVTEQRTGVATQWAWPGDGSLPCVRVTVQGSRFDEQVDTWFPAVDIHLL